MAATRSRCSKEREGALRGLGERHLRRFADDREVLGGCVSVLPFPVLVSCHVNECSVAYRVVCCVMSIVYYVVLWHDALLMSCRCVPNRIVSYRVVSRRVASRRVASRRVASRRVVS